MAVNYRLICHCGARIARSTYAELIKAAKERDWETQDNTAKCLPCQIEGV